MNLLHRCYCLVMRNIYKTQESGDNYSLPSLVSSTVIAFLHQFSKEDALELNETQTKETVLYILVEAI